MGCHLSSFHLPVKFFNFHHRNYSFTQDDRIQLETFLLNIPNHCQQTIINLSKQDLVNLIRKHRLALYFSLKKQWSLTIFYERQAIKRLQILLPNEKDHYAFSIFYNVLSAAFLAFGQVESAIEGIQLSVVIQLKHTPTDYRNLSKNYFYLASMYNMLQEWQPAIEYLLKAIETSRHMTPIDEDFVCMLENELEKTK